MNRRYILATVLLIVLAITSYTPALGQKLEGPETFQVSEVHEMEILTSSKLLWQEEQSELVRINFTMTEFPTNESEIEILLVQFFTTEDSPAAQPESQAINTTEIALSASNSSYQLVQTVPPPEAADRFYLNITLVAVARGGSASQEQKTFSYRFPETDTIIIERDNLVPVINLYGFPPGTFFGKWLPLYGGLLFLMLVPAMIYGVQLASEWRADQVSDEEIGESDQAPETDQTEENEIGGTNDE